MGQYESLVVPLSFYVQQMIYLFFYVNVRNGVLRHQISK